MQARCGKAAGGGEPPLQQENDLRLQDSGSGSGCATLRKWLEGHWRYFDAVAIVESLVAIMSGITVWLGMWDLLDEHVLPHTVPAKVLLIVASLLALYASRTLYDKELLHLREKERRRRKGLPGEVEMRAGSAPAGDSDVDAPATPRRARHDGSSDGDDRPAAALPAARPPPNPPQRMRRLYFDAPPFNATRFLRASFALLASLTLWIGMWDLLDYHIIPAMFQVCADQEWQCSFVKAGCVVVGMVGLYFTRTLYGIDTVKSAHFSRMQ